MSNRSKVKSTLCWSCRKSTNSGCSWSRALIPVDGWKAEEDHLKTNYADNQTYLVIECPEFVRDSVNNCDNCRYFAQTTGMYGYCKRNKIAVDIHRICGDWRRKL